MNIAMDLIREALLGGSGGGGGGGGISLELLYSEENTIETTTTAAVRQHQTVLDFPLEDDVYYIVHTYDKAGLRDGYFYSSLQVITLKGGSAQMNYMRCVGKDGSYYFSGANNYGITAQMDLAGNRFDIYSRYNSTSGGTINGTYHSDLYKLNLPEIKT